MSAPTRPHGADFNSLESDYATAPAMKWLIPIALDADTMTYGHLKQRLEEEAGFATIFSAHVGHVAGALMHRIQEVEPSAPLINALVVNQGDKQPSAGLGPFMAKRFNMPMLADEDAKSEHPDLWRETFERAAAEVHLYTEADWARLYHRVFGAPPSLSAIATDRAKRKQGTEKDGLQYGRGGGEGAHHKALREWVTANPGHIRRAFKDARTETEVDLLSGDRVDAVYYCKDRTIVLEVKSRISNEIDLRRGVYQCVKYRAVKKAMDVRDNAPIDAFLVTEIDPKESLPGDIVALLKLHDIKHYNAPQKRAD